jgi:hypothetical protein
MIDLRLLEGGKWTDGSGRQHPVYFGYDFMSNGVWRIRYAQNEHNGQFKKTMRFRQNEIVWKPALKRGWQEHWSDADGNWKIGHAGEGEKTMKEYLLQTWLKAGGSAGDGDGPPTSARATPVKKGKPTKSASRNRKIVGAKSIGKGPAEGTAKDAFFTGTTIPTSDSDVMKELYKSLNRPASHIISQFIRGKISPAMELGGHRFIEHLVSAFYTEGFRVDRLTMIEAYKQHKANPPFRFSGTGTTVTSLVLGGSDLSEAETQVVNAQLPVTPPGPSAVNASNEQLRSPISLAGGLTNPPFDGATSTTKGTASAARRPAQGLALVLIRKQPLPDARTEWYTRWRLRRAAALRKKNSDGSGSRASLV